MSHDPPVFFRPCPDCAAVIGEYRTGEGPSVMFSLDTLMAMTKYVNPRRGVLSDEEWDEATALYMALFPVIEELFQRERRSDVAGDNT